MGDSDDEDRLQGRQLKVVLLGNGTTGKTSIVTRFSQNHFGRNYQQTIGLDFFMKRMTIPGIVTFTSQLMVGRNSLLFRGVKLVAMVCIMWNTSLPRS